MQSIGMPVEDVIELVDEEEKRYVSIYESILWDTCYDIIRKVKR